MKKNNKKYTFNRKPSFNKGPQNLMMLVGFLLAFLLALSLLTDYMHSITSVPYSSFVKRLELGDVKQFSLSGQDVYGEFRDNSRFETVVPESADLEEIAKKHPDVEINIASKSAGYVWYGLLLLGLLAGMVGAWFYSRKTGKDGGGGGPGNIFSMGKSRARMFLPSEIKEKFTSVAGAQDAKEDLEDIVAYLKDPEKYKRLGAKISRGILMIGAPGNGKTMLARAIAGEANCPFFSISGSDFMEVFVGVGASRVRDLFKQARKNSPSIIFIDEIDAIGRHRGSGMGGGHDEREQTLNQLLTEMDGFENAGGEVIVIAATNRPEVLDEALLRPGRFDRRVQVPYPDLSSREKILELNSKNYKIDPSVDLKHIAVSTAGFSGADLTNLINEAAVVATKKGSSMISADDFEQARNKIAIDVVQKKEYSPSAARVFLPSEVKENFDSVAGAHAAKEELQDVVLFLKDPEKYKRLGAKIPRGVLMVGDPGNGKTLLARAVAGEVGCPFLSISGSEFVEKYVGVGASRVRDLFKQARRSVPCIVFIDEIDAVGGHRSGDMGGGNEERSQTLNQLLTEMDGFESEGGAIIVIAATNREDILDKALLRPGRFDRRVYVPYPDLASREQILEVHAKKYTIDETVDLKKIARGTSGFSGADLANLINEAALIATKNGSDSVTMHDFDKARDKITIGAENKSIIQTPEDLKLTAYHEAGHTLVNVFLPRKDTMPLEKVTIVPRGGALGVTHSLPERDKPHQVESEILASIAIACGGRAAEKILMGQVSTGAGSDYRYATDQARRMVCVLGMSDVGTAIYSSNGNSFKYSEKTAQRIDEHVQKILDECYVTAENIIKNNRDKLDALSNALIEKETLLAHEVYELLGLPQRESNKLV